MKLVEIVILVGTQCASPITPGFQASEVAKVPCAVVIERDTETRAVSVEPQSLAGHPKVRLALARPFAAPPVAQAIPPSASSGPQIAPAASAPLQQLAVPVPPPLPFFPPQAAAEQPPAQPSVPEMEEKEVALAPAVEVPGESQTESDAPVLEEKQAALAPAVEPETEAKPKPVIVKKAPAVKAVKRLKRKSTGRVASLAGKTKTITKSTAQCITPAKAVWYTNTSGQRKYRCARPGSGKAGLY